MNHYPRPREGAQSVLVNGIPMFATKDMICGSCGVPWKEIVLNPALECVSNIEEPEPPPISFRDWAMKLHADLTDLEVFLQRRPSFDKRRFAEDILPAIYEIQEVIEEITPSSPPKDDNAA